MKSTNKRTRALLLTSLLLVLCGGADLLAHGRQGFQVPMFPRASQRGHIRIRNGIFGSTYREKWGNGLTQYGAAAITTVATNAANVASQYFAVGTTPVAAIAATGAGSGGADDSVGSTEAAEAEAESARERDELDRQRDEKFGDAESSTKKAFEILGLKWAGFASPGPTFELPPPGAVDTNAPLGASGGTGGVSSQGNL